MESLQKTIALSVAGLYGLGVLISSIHLSRFAISDLVLTKAAYILAGGVCALYLVFRFSLAVAIVDLPVLLKLFSDARQSIHDRLEGTIIFRILGKVTALPVLSWFVGGFSPAGIARNLISAISALAVGLIVLIYTKIFDFRSAGLTVNTALQFPPVVAFLLWAEVGYISWCFLLPAFKTELLLRNFWRTVLGFLIVADIGFYALALHPLVKPSFGGGSVYNVHLQADSPELNNKETSSE